MPSTYSSSLRLELQATGENANTWGVKTNNNLNLIEQAVAGYVKITLASASATYTLTIADASASDGRNAFIEFVGTVASAISVVVPDVEKGYWVKNSATGSNLTFRTSSGTGFTLPTNQWVFVVTDGASAVNTTPTSLTGFARLTADQTFTGLNTFTSAATFTGPVSVSASAAFTQPVTINAPLSVTGAATFTSAVAVNAPLSVTGAAAFTSAVTINAPVSITGLVTMTSAVVVAAPLSVTGAAVFTSTVNVSKALTVAATVESTLGGVKFPDGTLQSTAAAAASTIAAGCVFDYAGTAAPSGYLLCYGQAVSRSTYADLYAAIGTTYGSGDGINTFNLPDARGRVIAGKDDMGGSAANRLTSGGSGITGTTLGASGGAQTVTLGTTEMPAHTHTVGAAGCSPGAGLGGLTTGTVNTGSTGGGGAHQNTQPTIIMNKIIKT